MIKKIFKQNLDISQEERYWKIYFEIMLICFLAFSLIGILTFKISSIFEFLLWIGIGFFPVTFITWLPSFIFARIFSLLYQKSIKSPVIWSSVGILIGNFYYFLYWSFIQMLSSEDEVIEYPFLTSRYLIFIIIGGISGLIINISNRISSHSNNIST